MINSRSEQEYRALIRGWRIRFRNYLKEISTTGYTPSLREMIKLCDEMEKEVPDYVSPKEQKMVETRKG